MIIFLCVTLGLFYFIQWTVLLLNVDDNSELELKTKLDFMLWLLCPYYIVCRICIRLFNFYKSLPIEKKQNPWD